MKGCNAEAAQPREAHRATSKDVRANVSDTPRKKQHRCAEHARLRCSSLSHGALTHAGDPVLIGRKQFFCREVTVAWTEAYGQGYVHDAIHRNHWFLHKFKIYLADTLRVFKAAARLKPCHCSFTQRNRSGIPRSLWGHHHGWPDCATTELLADFKLLVRKVTWSSVTASWWQIWLPRKSTGGDRMRIICRCSEDGS